MDKDPKDTGKKKTHYSLSELQAELDALHKIVEEAKSIDEILNYLDERFES